MKELSDEQLFAAFYEQKHIIKVAEKKAAQFQEEIKNRFGYGKHYVGDYELQYTEVTTTRFDADSFKKQAPDIYAKYQKESVSSRLVVKLCE